MFHSLRSIARRVIRKLTSPAKASAMSFRPGLDAFGGFLSPPSPYTTAASFRPHLEQLDERVVPAVNHWLGTVSTDFDTAANWGLNRLPQAGDDVWFVPTLGPGGAVSVDCEGMSGPSGGEYNSVFLDNGYDAVVELSQGFDTKALIVLGGTIDQPYYSSDSTDITVTGGPTIDGNNSGILSGRPDFHWTGGTINSTSHAAELVLDGATGEIEPDGGTVHLGSTLRLVGEAVVTAYPGTVSIEGGTGVEIDSDCTLDMAPQQDAVVEFKGTETDIRTITGRGFLRVITPGVAKSIPIAMLGGELTVKSDAELIVNQNLSIEVLPGVWAPIGSVYNYGGSVHLDTGSKLTTEFGMWHRSGWMYIHVTEEGSEVATITGLLEFSGGSLDYVFESTTAGPWGILRVDGDVVWNGGTFLPDISLAVAEQNSQWTCTGSMTIDGTASINPVPWNVNQALPGRPHTVLKAENGSITGTPGFDATAYNLGTAGNPVNRIIISDK